jgi:hypothetical protein
MVHCEVVNATRTIPHGAPHQEETFFSARKSSTMPLQQRGTTDKGERYAGARRSILVFGAILNEGPMPHKDVMRSIELFGKEVMPALHEITRQPYD